MNGTLRGWSGHTADEMVGKRFSDFLTMAGRIDYETHIAPLLRMQGSFEEFAIDVIKADGQPLQMIANAKERRDAQDKPLSVRLTLNRATDRRRYEQELLGTCEGRRPNCRGEAAARARSIGAARAVHRGARPRSAQPARFHQRRRPHSRQNGSDREGASGIAMMQTTVMRMAGLIDDVLDLARGRRGGGIGLNRDQGKPLEPVLLGVVDEPRLASPGRVIQADFKIDRPVNCDRSRLGQLLSNLVGNALTHGASSKPVFVHADLYGHGELRPPAARIT